jgi:transcriptional regulator of acetoin/glycerol metabolism
MHARDPRANERALAQARLLRARGTALPPDGLPAPEILDSWLRCQERGLDFARPPRIDVVEGSELALRRERSDFVRRLAQAELETLAQQIAGSNFLLAFADRDGVILDLYADNRFRLSGSAAGIVAGSCWSEERCGTNGLGTALAARHSVAVTGLDHYHLTLGDISCTAAPICDARGEVVGVLDASSYVESRQRHTQALVRMAATQIENMLLAHQMRERWVLAIHPRAEFIGTLSVGLLAFDDGGALVALNERARQLLSGLELARGARFDELFGESFVAVVARLALRGELRLRDALGSALVMRCVAQPPRRELVAAASAAAARAAPPPAPARAAVRSAEPGRPFAADDPALRDAVAMAESAMRMNVPLLLHGETGTGKELLARHLHAASGRRGAFVAVNCGALPADLFESELFGYAGGAFTGARREGSAGLIASADGGTLLLDEVRELPLPLQAALLRFLDDRQVRPVGGVASRRVDVMLIAATNVNLDDEVAARRFRADLLYRLDTLRVVLPPLRARSDFAAAAHAVLAELEPQARLSEAALALLARQPWLGNFRELRSVLTRALVASGRHRLDEADVAAVLPAPALAAPSSALQRGASAMIRRELERCGGSVSAAARSLGISRTTIYRHLKATGA